MYDASGGEPTNKSINNWLKTSGYKDDINGKKTMGKTTQPDVKLLKYDKGNNNIKNFIVNRR